MSDFSSNLPSSKLDSSQKEQLMEQVKAQIAVANAQEILHVRRCLYFWWYSVWCRGQSKWCGQKLGE